MSKHVDNTDMKALKTATCKTLSGKSTLTYQLGCDPDNEIHLRITKNSGGGFFSDEWVKYEDIQAVLKERSEISPIMSHFISPLLKGKSSNTSGFIMAVLSHLKLIRSRYSKGTGFSWRRGGTQLSPDESGADRRTVGNRVRGSVVLGSRY